MDVDAVGLLCQGLGERGVTQAMGGGTGIGIMILVDSQALAYIL